MDPNIRDILVAALPVVGGILVAILVAKITADRTLDLERARWRRDIYATFLHASDAVRDGVHAVVEGLGDGNWPSNIEVAQKALAEITILSPKMAPEAARMWNAAGELMKGVIRMDAAQPLGGGAVVPIDHSKYQTLDAASRGARAVYRGRGQGTRLGFWLVIRVVTRAKVGERSV